MTGGPFPPRCAARFEHQAEIASGGYGSVHRALQHGLRRPVAIKLFDRAPDAPRERARFAQEAMLTAQLAHPHIVKIIDHDVEDTVPWIAYELLDGASLRGRVLSWKEAAHAGAQVASALALAHARGVLHRDVKPDNVIEARPGHVKLTDFGIAKWSGGAAIQTEAGTLVGSPAYLAPELVQGEAASSASDVYALGATLFELLSGQPPFPGRTVIETLDGHVHRPPPALPGVPAALAGPVQRCLAKIAADRPTAAALARTLEALADQPPLAPTVAVARLAGGGRTRVPLAAGALTLVFIALFASSAPVPSPAPATPSTAPIDFDGPERELIDQIRAFKGAGLSLRRMEDADRVRADLRRLGPRFDTLHRKYRQLAEHRGSSRGLRARLLARVYMTWFYRELIAIYESAAKRYGADHPAWLDPLWLERYIEERRLPDSGAAHLLSFLAALHQACATLPVVPEIGGLLADTRNVSSKQRYYHFPAETKKRTDALIVRWNEDVAKLPQVGELAVAFWRCGAAGTLKKSESAAIENALDRLAAAVPETAPGLRAARDALRQSTND